MGAGETGGVPKYLNNPIKPEYVEPFARCAPGGPTKSFEWHGYEIRQFPGYVVFLFDSGNRVIYLDGRPHLPENLKLWNGDSRGHWEGNTLVVDTTNNNSKWRFGRSGEFVSENATVVERFVLRWRPKRRQVHLRRHLDRPDRADEAVHDHHPQQKGDR